MFTLSNITEQQLRVISEALDLYSRVLTGQLNEVPNVLRKKLALYNQNEQSRDDINQAISTIKRYMFPNIHPYVAYSIGSPDTNIDAKRAYEIYKVIDIYMHPFASVNQGATVRHLTDESVMEISEV